MKKDQDDTGVSPETGAALSAVSPSQAREDAAAIADAPPHEPDYGRTGNPVHWCERCRIDAERAKSQTTDPPAHPEFREITFSLDTSVMDAMVKAIALLCEKGMPLPEIAADAFTWQVGGTVHTIMLPRLYPNTKSPSEKA